MVGTRSPDADRPAKVVGDGPSTLGRPAKVAGNKKPAPPKKPGKKNPPAGGLRAVFL
jgi:hypothetical protein